jgi:6-pyruvoyl tetrahydropterin synthase/QueD family protein
MLIEMEEVVSAAHFVHTRYTKCWNLHGHNYIFKVKVEADGTCADGEVIDFLDIKTLLKALDHKVLIPTKDSGILVNKGNNYVKIQVPSVSMKVAAKEYILPEEECEFLPIKATTAELLAELMAQRIFEMLVDRKLQGTVHVVCQETSSSSATASVGDIVEVLESLVGQ